jgi:diguanylate cyclase (GGDEF)-like protein
MPPGTMLVRGCDDRASCGRAEERSRSVSRSLSRAERRVLRVTFALAVVVVAATAFDAAFGGGAAAQAAIGDGGSSALYAVAAGVVWLRVLRSPSNRTPWSIFAVGLSLYAIGNLLWASWLEHERHPPIPSICDALWLSLYPLSYTGIVGLAGIRRRALPAGVWLDGIIAGLGLAALSTAAVLPHLLSSARGSSIGVATELAYPICDLVLAALVVGVLALRGWRIDRMWALLGAGFMMLAIADCVYALRVANGASSSSIVANLFYLIGVSLLAVAAWQDESPESDPRLDRWSVLLVPGALALGSLGLLAYGQVSHLHPLPYTLALLALLAGLVRAALTFKDVRTLAETRRQARTDELTSLANRRQLLDAAEHAIAAAGDTGAGVAMMLIDLDDFKEINDTLGHHAGDLLLSQIGPRLRSALRSEDTVARLGGDEFCVVLDPADHQSALLVAERVRTAIAKPFSVEGLDLSVAASIGIALFPEHGHSATELLRHADMAMYRAKSTRRGVQLYGGDRGIDPRERLGVARELASAIRAGELEVHYQPQADARTGRIVTVEALVRWRHPDRGLLAPFEFISVAEQAGLARDLTRAVLGTALDQLASWLADGLDLRLAVNLTLADLLDGKFPTEVERALAERRLPATSLVLELSEATLNADPERIRNALARLGEIGVGLSLDDFGSGVSSLAQLRAAPVGEVKLDRSVIAGITGDPTDAAMIHCTIMLSHQLGMRVVAEGAEDHATLAAVTAAGCDGVQGFALARPLPAAELRLTTRINAA